MNLSSCIVFEDAPKGVEFAYNAGMNAVVLTTMHENMNSDNIRMLCCSQKISWIVSIYDPRGACKRIADRIKKRYLKINVGYTRKLNSIFGIKRSK